MQTGAASGGNPVITVGVPVYNGADLLDECLAALAAQTFPDFVVRIYDNASTDATGDIAHAWSAKDSRFIYFRQTENRGAKQNFLDVLAASDTQYFLWRAYDDLSDPGFLEALYGAMISRAGVKLAVPVVISENMDGTNRRERMLPPLENTQGLAAIRQRLFGSHASWFYGLWDRTILNRTMAETWGHFPSDWGSDHLAIFPLLLEGSVAGAPDARFIQRIKRTQGSAKRPMTISAAEMLDLRRRFEAYCLGCLEARDDPPLKRFLLRRMISRYAAKRVYSNLKLAKLWWRGRKSSA
ncbi:MAG: glycosyltransferase family 2 protein [Beijerinckiaceae bacterium]